MEVSHRWSRWRRGAALVDRWKDFINGGKLRFSTECHGRQMRRRVYLYLFRIQISNEKWPLCQHKRAYNEAMGTVFKESSNVGEY